MDDCQIDKMPLIKSKIICYCFFEFVGVFSRTKNQTLNEKLAYQLPLYC